MHIHNAAVEMRRFLIGEKVEAVGFRHHARSQDGVRRWWITANLKDGREAEVMQCCSELEMYLAK